MYIYFFYIRNVMENLGSPKRINVTKFLAQLLLQLGASRALNLVVVVVVFGSLNSHLNFNPREMREIFYFDYAY